MAGRRPSGRCCASTPRSRWATTVTAASCRPCCAPWPATEPAPEPGGQVIEEFRKFLLQTNALALAIGVVIGAAVGKVVSSLVADVLMPVISLAIPGGTWREAKIVLATNPDGTA